MAHDLGDVVPLTVEVRNPAGTLENATGVTLTLTLPDATTATPTPTNPSTGLYAYDYATVQAGRHVVRWVFTGSNAGAFTDVFHVNPSTVPALVSLDDLRTKLNLSGTDAARDEQLRHYIDVASAVCEQKVGPVAVRTVVETVNAGRSSLVLRQAPVVAVTSVTVDGTALAADTYALHASSGVVYSPTGAVLGNGTTTVVTYTAGRPVVPADILEGVVELVRHLWATKRGPTAPNRLGPAETADTYAPSGYGYLLPHRVEQLWSPHVPLPLG